MKKLLPLLAFLATLAFLASGLFSPKQTHSYDLDSFGHLPVLLNGRIKPLDTVARTTLLSMQDRQRVRTADDQDISPIEWMLDAAFRPQRADTYRTFKIDNPDLLTLVGKTEENLKIEYTSSAKRVLAILGFLPSKYRRFSYQEISPFLQELERQAQLAQAVDAQGRNPFQKAVLNLYGSLISYQQVKYSFVLPDSSDWLAELKDFAAEVPKGIEAVRAKQQGKPHDEAVAQHMIDAVKRFELLSRFGSLYPVPPPQGDDPQHWRKVGEALLDTFQNGELNTSAQAYASMGAAWRAEKPDLFNQTLERYRAHLYGSVGERLGKVNTEVLFNTSEPFYKSMQVFAVAFALAIASWFFWPVAMGRAAYAVMLAAFIVTTAGIVTRMWLEGRPPVTNLYSSALFIGWAAVGLCLILESIYKNAIGTVAGGAVGFCTLLIAHHLSFGGDTMEMMRAVLDSNFWLATHVVVITLGYASTFLAGMLGILYIVMGVFTKWLPQQFDRRAALRSGELAPKAAAKPAQASSAKPVTASRKAETNGEALTRMAYGIICFATLFSLIGTILGGIWADQSWGRFWGWDPKENGALIIVIWNALILHARWGGMVKARGLMCLAVFGNVVTSWSWFGTNMLGIGLHSYGFMDAAFYWLIGFVISQAVIILLGTLVPLESWRSFRPTGATVTPPPKAQLTAR
jgi:cytochrome c-type biogenesis protein CcsB